MIQENELELAIQRVHEKIAETVLEPFCLTCDNDGDELSTISNESTLDELRVELVA